MSSLERDRDLQVLTTQTADDARRWLGAGTGVDAVLVDLESIGDGDDAIVEAVRDFDATIPVLVLGSGRSSGEERPGITYDEQGVHRIESPSADTIRELLERAIGEYGGRPESAGADPLPAMLSAAPVALVVIDGSGRIDFANPAVADVIGYHPEELVGESVTSLLPDWDDTQYLDEFVEYLSAVEESPTREYVEVTGQHAAGHELPLGLSFGGFRHEGRQHFVVTITSRPDDGVDRATRSAERGMLSNRLARRERLVQELLGVTSGLVRSDSQTAFEREVCRTLAQSDRIAFAWIGDVEDGAIQVRTHAGQDRGYLEAISGRDLGDREPALRTYRDRSPTVVDDVDALSDRDSWASAAWARGIRSVATVPIVEGDRLRGVLAVYATVADAFDDRDRRVLERIGDVTAFGIGGFERDRALLAETVVELRLELVGGDDVFGRLARESGATVEFDGVVVREDTLLVFLDVADIPPDVVVATLETDPSVVEAAAIGGELGNRFKVVVDTDPLFTRIVRAGARVEDISADPDGTFVRVSMPVDGDVRALMRSLRGVYDEVTLRSRNERHREFVGDRGMRGELVANLTDRQLEVLETAFYSGYFEWPRERSSEEVAASLDISQPTFNHHLRIAERKLLSVLFGSVPDGDD